MLKQLVKLKRFLFGPRTELEFTEAALRRYKRELSDMDYDIDHTDYPLDMYDYHYSYLIDKIKRVEAQIVRLKKRKQK